MSIRRATNLSPTERQSCAQDKAGSTDRRAKFSERGSSERGGKEFVGALMIIRRHSATLRMLELLRNYWPLLRSMDRSLNGSEGGKVTSFRCCLIGPK